MKATIPSRQFILFLFAGGLAAAVNFGSRIALSHWMDYVPSIIIAYLLGMMSAFMLNKLFVSLPYGKVSVLNRKWVGG